MTLAPVATFNVPALVCVRQDQSPWMIFGMVANAEAASKRIDARPRRRGSIGLVSDLDWEVNAYCSSRWAVTDV